jgi:TrmH family RNA methyltransferase
MTFLASKDNAKIKHLRALIEQNQYRKKHQQTVLEGTHLCLAWLQTHKNLVSLFTTEAALEHPDLEKSRSSIKGKFLLLVKVYIKISAH